MKKLLAVIIAVITVFSLTACGAALSPENTIKDAEEKEEGRKKEKEDTVRNTAAVSESAQAQTMAEGTKEVLAETTAAAEAPEEPEVYSSQKSMYFNLVDSVPKLDTSFDPLFSEGLAWVTYAVNRGDYNKDYYFGLIDTAGELIYTSEINTLYKELGFSDGDALYASEFENGSSVIIPYYDYGNDYTEQNFAIIDTEGNITFKQLSTDEEIYHCLGHHNGEYLIGKKVTTFDKLTAYYYTIDRYGNITHEPVEIEEGLIDLLMRTPFTYYGNGCYCNGGFYQDIDINTNTGEYKSERAGFKSDWLENGIILGNSGNGVDLVYKVPEGRDPWVLKDEDLELVCNFREYFPGNLIEIDTGTTDGKYFTAFFRGADKNLYRAVVDTKGNMLYDPVRIGSEYSMTTGFKNTTLVSGYLLTDGGWIDTDGNFVAYGGDLSGIGMDSYSRNLLSEGFFRITPMRIGDSLPGIENSILFISLDGSKVIDKVHFTENTRLQEGSPDPADTDIREITQVNYSKDRPFAFFDRCNLMGYTSDEMRGMNGAVYYIEENKAFFPPSYSYLPFIKKNNIQSNDGKTDSENVLDIEGYAEKLGIDAGITYNGNADFEFPNGIHVIFGTETVKYTVKKDGRNVSWYAWHKNSNMAKTYNIYEPGHESETPALTFSEPRAMWFLEKALLAANEGLIGNPW